MHQLRLDNMRQKIVEILLANEDALSDGYHWYAGEDKVQEKLEKISDTIISEFYKTTPSGRGVCSRDVTLKCQEYDKDNEMCKQCFLKRA